MCASSSAASSMRPNVQSKIQLPLSVTYGASPPRRAIACGPSRASSRSTQPAEYGTISTGVGKRPSRSTSFSSVTITTKRWAASATAFSRKSAPPPPLVSAKSGATSSAPSIATAISRSISPASGMLRLRHNASVTADVATAAIRSPAATRSPTRSIAQRAVVPVPRPMHVPSTT